MRAPSAAPSTSWCIPGPASKIDKVAGIEARGFIIGGAVAHQLSAGFVPIRKKGKLPHETVSIAYSLEYGLDEMEMHTRRDRAGESVHPGRRSDRDRRHGGGGGQAAAEIGAEVVAACFVIDLPDLGGAPEDREGSASPVRTLVDFAGH